MQSLRWPILRRYDQTHLSRIALPLGGIGTGTVSLSGHGALRDWEIMNRPGKGFTPQCIFSSAAMNYGPFFALYTKVPGRPPDTRLLEGPLAVEEYEGPQGCRAVNHGLPRFRKCDFAAAYPLGQAQLQDRNVPVTARIEAFNPLIPGDAEASGIPVAALRFVLTNRTAKNVTASICGTLPNFIGSDGSQTERLWTFDDIPTGAKGNVNTIQAGQRVRGILMSSTGVDPQAEQWGTIALTTTARAGITSRLNWADTGWGGSLLDFWNDFSRDGTVEERPATGVAMPTGSLAVKFALPPRATRAITFLITWHFPNRQSWTPLPDTNNNVGNFYTTRYRDAWHVAEEVARDLPKLEAKTVAFVRAFCDSDLPAVIKESALFNISTLRTQTCFRTADGRFFGWEGCHDKTGSCHGSAKHVWDFEQATAFLFGELARSMRDTEFAHATRDNGMMSVRVNLPIARAAEHSYTAADGQMATLMKLYQDWQLAGEDTLLRRLWPKARKALEFAWIPGGWDADRDGVMEGCQHNTMDVEYYGPNAQCGAWYLGALRAAEEMARRMGEQDFADECRRLFESGSRWLDAHLFNGEYYEHEIRPPGEWSTVAPGLRGLYGATNPHDPDLQLGAGCLVDQLAGQFMAHVCGLGYLLDRQHVATTLRSIKRHNFRQGFHDHFNHCRSYVAGDEAGLLMATWPRGRKPARPFPYFNEVMTGFEYSAAIGMLYEGQTAAGLKCIQAIRDRYDGRKRNPFDEAECGHHYARAMASWASVLAWTGFQYSAVTKTLTFAAKPGTWFWSNGSAWGTCRIQKRRARFTVTLEVKHGQLALHNLVLTGSGQITLPRPVKLADRKQLHITKR